jgi:hypothetical protein
MLQYRKGPTKSSRTARRYVKERMIAECEERLASSKHKIPTCSGGEISRASIATQAISHSVIPTLRSTSSLGPCVPISRRALTWASRKGSGWRLSDMSRPCSVTVLLGGPIAWKTQAPGKPAVGQVDRKGYGMSRAHACRKSVGAVNSTAIVQCLEQA